jgi:hypothetical protein
VQRIHLELEALQAKRTDLAQQLEILGNRRAQLADQISRTESGMRAAPEARLRELDARIARLEQESQQTDNQISALLNRLASEPVAEHVEVPTAPVPPVFEFPPGLPGHFTNVPPAGWSEHDMLRVAGLEAAGLLLLTAVLCRWTWLRAKRRFAPRQAVDNTQLQLAVDAIAIEVERISEGQRFVTNLLDQRLSEKREARSGGAPGAGASPKYKSVTPV